MYYIKLLNLNPMVIKNLNGEFLMNECNEFNLCEKNLTFASNEAQ